MGFHNFPNLINSSLGPSKPKKCAGSTLLRLFVLMILSQVYLPFPKEWIHEAFGSIE
jgi:hypothetical protein